MKKLLKLPVIVVILLCSTTSLYAQKRITTSEYINKYKDLAITEMKRSGIPASIKLAQGIVETGSGNSTLAVKANNHFGLKCHKWDKDKYYHDDDAKNECFRKYDSADESYRDHSDFLMNTLRYKFLFEYASDDYKSWAFGLQKAGYATNNKYAETLIRTIEENKLYLFDSDAYKNTMLWQKADSDKDIFEISIHKKRTTYERNRVKYIVVKEGDNLKSLTKELDLFSWQLKKYNELPDNYEPQVNEILYIQPKRNRAEVGNDYHIVKKGETMHSISQLYAIKLKKLYKKNKMEYGKQPDVGQKIWLRKTKPNSF